MGVPKQEKESVEGEKEEVEEGEKEESAEEINSDMEDAVRYSPSPFA